MSDTEPIREFNRTVTERVEVPLPAGPRFDTWFDPEASISADAAELTEPAGLLLVARLRNEPVGCGALKLHDDEPAEIKRMWISPSARGLGLDRRLLSPLETEAAVRGATTTRLETNRALVEAINLYHAAVTERSRRSTTSPLPTTGSRNR